MPTKYVYSFMLNFNLFWKRLVRGGLTLLKVELLMWIVLFAVAGIVYFIVSVL
ncbi:MAG TPA: hypothetical protein VD884_14995 [Ohtaekwangia sp.]|nr:hypothetical protein [Ohtaekwangia sp.]